MIIVTDNGLDLAPEILDKLQVEIVPLELTLDGKTYQGGVDIQSDEFYKLVRASDGYPTTSQPSPAAFDEVYTRWIEHDPQILSIHMSQQLSGTVNAARLGAEMAAKKGAQVTVLDSHTVSGPLGWQVEVAARAAAANWPTQQIVELVRQVGAKTRVIFSPDTLKYLVHGGRVSHLQGMAASVLNIKPLLQITHETGRIESIGRVRTLRKAVDEQVRIIEQEYGAGAALRVQIEHTDNPEMAAYAHDIMSQRFRCHYLPTTSITPIVGAHLGPGGVSIVYAPLATFEQVPD
jgi:DegV family protein with EDD domain